MEEGLFSSYFANYNMCKFDNEIKKYITDNKLIAKGDRVGVAVSGGVDSMCLLKILVDLKDDFGISLFVLHFEHGIRKEDSVNDAKFVESFCNENDIAFVMESGDVISIAKAEKISIETAARNSRYSFFERCSDKYNLDKIALAHHQDDQAETILFNLVRGSGGTGLSAMSAFRSPNYIRPFLDVSKEAILLYANQKGVVFVIDQSNFDVKYSRNRIRNNIFADLKKVNSNAVSNILRTSKIISDDNDFLEEIASKEYKKRVAFIDDEAVINLDKWEDIHVCLKRRIIRKAIGEIFSIIDIEFVHIEYIINNIDGSSGKRLNIGKGLIASICYDKLFIFEDNIKEDIFKPLIIKNQTFAIDGFKFDIKVCESYKFSKGIEYFDIDKLDGSCFRYPKENDYIYPLGMKGKKKLSDYMCDKKIPLHKRKTALVLTKGDEVIWVVGHGINDLYKVTKDIKRVFEISFSKND